MFAVNFLTYLLHGGNTAAQVSFQGTENASSAGTALFSALFSQALQHPVQNPSNGLRDFHGLFSQNETPNTGTFGNLVSVNVGETDADIKAAVSRTYPQIQLAKSATIWKLNEPLSIQLVENGQENSVAVTAVQFIPVSPVSDQKLRGDAPEGLAVPIAFLALTVEGINSGGQPMDSASTNGSSPTGSKPVNGTGPSFPAEFKQSGKLLVPIVIAQGEHGSGDATWGTTVFHSPSETAVRVEVGDGEWLPLNGQRGTTELTANRSMVSRPSSSTTQETTVSTPQADLQIDGVKLPGNSKDTPMMGLKAEQPNTPFAKNVPGKPQAQWTPNVTASQSSGVQTGLLESVADSGNHQQASKPLASNSARVSLSSSAQPVSMQTEPVIPTERAGTPGTHNVSKSNAPSGSQQVVQQIDQNLFAQANSAKIQGFQFPLQEGASGVPREGGQAPMVGAASPQISAAEIETPGVRGQNSQPLIVGESATNPAGDVPVNVGKPAGTPRMNEPIPVMKSRHTLESGVQQPIPSVTEPTETGSAPVQQPSATVRVSPSDKARLLQMFRLFLVSANPQSGGDVEPVAITSGNPVGGAVSAMAHPMRKGLEQLLKFPTVSNMPQGEIPLVSLTETGSRGIERTFMPGGKTVVASDSMLSATAVNVAEMVPAAKKKIQGKSLASHRTFPSREHALDGVLFGDSRVKMVKTGDEPQQHSRPMMAQETPSPGKNVETMANTATRVARGNGITKTTDSVAGTSGLADTVESGVVKSPLFTGAEGNAITKMNGGKPIVQNTPMNVPPMTARLEDVMEMITRWTEQMRYRSTATQQEITIQLRPETLGAIRVWLSMKENKLHARIETQRPEATAVIHQSSAQLISRLEEMNIHVQQFDVQTNSEFSAFHARQEGRERFAGQAGHSTGFESENNATGNATRQPRWVGYNTIDLIA